MWVIIIVVFSDTSFKMIRRYKSRDLGSSLYNDLTSHYNKHDYVNSVCLDKTWAIHVNNKKTIPAMFLVARKNADESTTDLI